jgi:hypothetical protein
MRPPWLQELRDLVGWSSYEARQHALQAWEARWLVELQSCESITPEALAGAADRKARLLRHACEHVRWGIGQELTKIMVEPTIQPSPHRSWGGEPMIEVRADVVAIRTAPQEACMSPESRQRR